MFYPIDDNGNDIRYGDEVKFIDGLVARKTVFQVVDILNDNTIVVLSPDDKTYNFKSMNCRRVYQGSDARESRLETSRRIPPYTIDIPVGSGKFKP